MRRLFFGLLVLLPTLAFGQDLRSDGDWTLYSQAGGCIGGSTCKERRLRIALDDRPVIGVRFYAHDQIGTKADGTLRVKIDGNTIRDFIDIPRRGETFHIDVDELRGRYLVFEPASDDEIEISQIAVQYTTARRRADRRIIERPSGGREGWKSYDRSGGCIGGDECGSNGDRIIIPLDHRPVLGVRFYAHDAIGERADGRLSVSIDETTIASYVDVQRAGKRHDFDVNGIRGSKLVIETTSNDEVEISDIEVLYGRGSGGSGSFPPEVRDPGACIGGGQCGGRHARIRIALDGRPVDSIRFYARDDIGERAGGELRIRIDDQILEYALDIPREGRTFTVDGDGKAGQYLYIEPAENDEVDIKDIRVKFGREDYD